MLHFGIFVAVTGGSLAFLVGLFGLVLPNGRQVRRRLAGVFSPGVNLARTALYKDADGFSDGPRAPDAAGAPVGRFLVRWQRGADEFLRQAGLPWSARQVAAGALALGVVLGGLGCIGGGWFAGLAAAAGGGSGPLVVIVARRKVRMNRYLAQLVGTFEMMARVLRSGQSVPEAFRAAVTAFEDPLSTEFGRCLHQMEHGLRPEAAFRELSERSGILELRIFVVAMTIQRQSGGNLAEVLDRLAVVLRTRVRVKQKIRALTAEGRLQSMTLIVMPVVTFLAMYLLNPQYAELLLAQSRLLGATAACMAVGVVWIRNIMNFEG